MSKFKITIQTRAYPERQNIPLQSGEQVELLHMGVRLSAPTMAGLRRLARAFCDNNDVGMHDWHDPCVVRRDEVIGFMSYNGRVWDRPTYPANEVPC